MKINQITPEMYRNMYVGKKIHIYDMKGEPRYSGKEGICTSVDDICQLHGTWGGCALIIGEDIFDIVE